MSAWSIFVTAVAGIAVTGLFGAGCIGTTDAALMLVLVVLVRIEMLLLDIAKQVKP